MSRIYGSLVGCCGLLAALLTAASPASAVAGYGDVAEGQYFAGAVQWSVDNNITDVTGACFSPHQPVSRGETAVWIWNMENRPTAAHHSFVDVTDPSQGNAVSWLAETEITTGTSPTAFSPDKTLTRAEIAAFLHRLADQPEAPAHSFVDVESDWQQNPVSWLAESEITTGTSPTRFSPDNTLTRAQLITFLYRYKDEPAAAIDPHTPTCDPDAIPTVPFSAVSAGQRHSCALTTDGSARCWGDNESGQSDAPQGSFIAVSAGDSHSCAVSADGEARCWGNDESGQSGVPDGDFSAVSAGSFP